MPLAPARAVRIESDELAAQRGAREPLDLHLAAGGGERPARRGAHDLGIVLVGDDHPATVGPELGPLEAGAVELGRQAPIEAVAELEVVGPLAVAEQVASG